MQGDQRKVGIEWGVRYNCHARFFSTVPSGCEFRAVYFWGDMQEKIVEISYDPRASMRGIRRVFLGYDRI
jgi:hypothetical protein